VIILDTLLLGGLRFVLEKIADAVDSELNDENVLREELLAVQMQRELGELTEDEFVPIERALLQRLREIRERARGEDATPGELTITGIEATVVEGDERGDQEHAPRLR
jgi:hypothetical protein